MTVIDYKETMKCLDEVEDCDDKTYAKSLLEWAINKRTFEAVPLSVIEKIKTEIHNEITSGGKWSGGYYEVTEEYAIKKFDDIIDKAVKECTHEA